MSETIEAPNTNIPFIDKTRQRRAVTAAAIGNAVDGTISSSTLFSRRPSQNFSS
jgi:hypothetical protein